MKKFFSFVVAALLSVTVFAAEPVTVTKTIGELAAANSWETSVNPSPVNVYTPFALDDVVTVSAIDTTVDAQKNAVYWANTTDANKSDIRFYQARSNGWVSVSVKEGYELKSVKFTYSIKNSGVLATEPGSSIAEDKRIPSETVYACSGQSVMFYVANTGTATNGQVRFTEFEITYKSTAVEKKPFKVKAGEDLQAAINAAESGDTILVQAGTYTGNFTMKDGVQLIGGWNADFTAQTDYASVLDANKNGRVLNQPADFTTLTIVENFTIQNGYLETSSDQGAAGVWLCRKGRVQHCLIQDNKIATSPSGNMMGGGVSCNTGMADPDTLVYDCIIRRNTATHGGGIRVNGKGIVILNSVIEDNETVNNAAGGVHMHNGSKLINCIVRNNKANGDTGGVRLSGGNVSDIFNCLIAGNVATASVGGVAIEGNNKANFINNTVVANKQMKAGATASLAGVKVKNDIGGDATTLFVNNIIWGNITGDTIAPQGVYYISKYDKTSGARSYNAIQGQCGDDDKTGTTSWMLTNDDPGFVNAANGDYRLAASSALHNIGSTAQAQGTKDLAGNARILQDIVDLGCYETEYVAPMVANKHIMAYDLKAELAGGIYTFSFKSNENATDAQIVFYNESVVIGSQNISGVRIGENSIQIAAANLPGENGQVLRWSIDLTSSNIDAVTEFSDDSDKFRYYATRGMAINCYPETEGFGTIYLCVPSAGASDGGSTYTKTMTMGFRQFDAALTLKNDGNVGFTAGMTWLDASTAPYRVQVGEDGLVYFSANHASMKGVWRVNEWDMSTATTGATNVINSGELTYGFCVEGVGAARTIYAMEGIGYDASAGGLGNINKYEIGTADVFSGTPVLVSTANNAKQVNSGDNMATDGNGGFWFYQNRSAEGASMPILAHMTSGVVDYTSADAALGLADSRRGAFAVSPNKQYLACGTAAKVTVFKVVSFNTNNVPTLEKVGEFTSDRLGNNIDGMAFDYANNVYVANSSKEWLQAFALPTTDNSSSVMARVAMSVTVQKTATSVQELINNSYLGVQKVIINGALYIIRDGVMYNMQGQLVK